MTTKKEVCTFCKNSFTYLSRHKCNVSKLDKIYSVSSYDEYLERYLVPNISLTCIDEEFDTDLKKVKNYLIKLYEVLPEVSTVVYHCHKKDNTTIINLFESVGYIYKDLIIVATTDGAQGSGRTRQKGKSWIVFIKVKNKFKFYPYAPELEYSSNYGSTKQEKIHGHPEEGHYEYIKHDYTRQMDVIFIPRPYSPETLHRKSDFDEFGIERFSRQKPVELYRRFILHYTDENDIVLMINMRAGTCCAVAKHLNRRYIGLTTEGKYSINAIKVRLDKINIGDPIPKKEKKKKQNLSNRLRIYLENILRFVLINNSSLIEPNLKYINHEKGLGNSKWRYDILFSDSNKKLLYVELKVVVPSQKEFENQLLNKYIKNIDMDKDRLMYIAPELTPEQKEFCIKHNIEHQIRDISKITVKKYKIRDKQK